jgi:SWI/SNF-related matrix-associated actin-dependent regulator of chromatin subfamily A3
MSAKRRQEAISRFSVPLAAESVQETATPSRERIARTRNNPFIMPVESDANSDGGTESDFVTDGEDDEPKFPFQKTTQSKGKGKATAIPRGELSFNTSDENPRVMLLSLKAVSRNGRMIHCG